MLCGQSLIESGKSYEVYIIDIVLRDTAGDRVIAKLKDKSPESVFTGPGMAAGTVSGFDRISACFEKLQEVFHVFSLRADLLGR